MLSKQDERDYPMEHCRLECTHLIKLEDNILFSIQRTYDISSNELLIHLIHNVLRTSLNNFFLG